MQSSAGWRWSLAVAAMSAFVGAIAGAFLTGPYQLAASVFLAGLMGTIAFVDFREFRVPDILNLPAALGGLVVVALDARWLAIDVLPALGSAVLSMLVCGGIFLVLREAFFRLRGYEGLGFGDVKLAATGGVWLGWQDFPLAVLVAAIGAIILVAVATFAGRGAWSRERKIPFATFLAPAIWCCWIYVRTVSY
jgi:leader peptidase (prepilin peptidase) / N-methyltransferase